MSTARLLFVYNADSGLFNTLADIGHKIFSPATYSCDLCALTHGWFKERESWRAFVEGLDCPCDFMHRDEFRRRFDRDPTPLPAVFRVDADGRRHCCLDADGIAACDGPDALQRAIRQRCSTNPAPEGQA